MIKQVDDFKYLGSYLSNSAKDINVRIGCAWEAIRKLDSLWQSKLPRAYKIMFFKATVESVYLYGAESWTLTKTLERRLDGCYTRLLRHALNISWQQKVRNVVLYKDLPAISILHCHQRAQATICWSLSQSNDRAHSQCSLLATSTRQKECRWSAQNICFICDSLFVID